MCIFATTFDAADRLPSARPLPFQNFWIRHCEELQRCACLAYCNDTVQWLANSTADLLKEPVGLILFFLFIRCAFLLERRKWCADTVIAYRPTAWATHWVDYHCVCAVLFGWRLTDKKCQGKSYKVVIEYKIVVYFVDGSKCKHITPPWRSAPSPPFDNISIVMMVVWRLRGNIIRTVLYW